MPENFCHTVIYPISYSQYLKSVRKSWSIRQARIELKMKIQTYTSNIESLISSKVYMSLEN